ncbi:MAG: transposase [Bacteroidota bacterium]
MSSRYTFHPDHSLYFTTFTVVEWLDVFTRPIYREILYDSFKYCIREKGLQIHAYVIMTNHLHLIISSKGEELSAIVRDFKKYTAKRILEHIQTLPTESRKNWMMPIFREFGEKTANTILHQFWRHNNKPFPLWSEGVIRQKLRYIHQNPVKAGWVDKSSHWTHSSAGAYEGRSSFIPLQLLDIWETEVMD